MSKSAFGLSILGRRKPKRKSGFLMTLSKMISTQVELMGALRRWINDARPDLRGIANGEEFETFKREFFDSQGAQTFDVMINFLKKSKLAYVKQHRPPAKTRLRPVGMQTAPEILKADALAQECRNSAERVNWDRVAKKCLRDPGKPAAKRKRTGETLKMTWAQRVQDLKQRVSSYKRRLRKSEKVS
jgi:hypothetical protein